MKSIMIPIFAVMVLAISASVAVSQDCGCAPVNPACQPCAPSYQQFCQQNYGNSCVGERVLNDKLVRPFNSCMSTGCDSCGMGGCGFGGHGCGRCGFGQGCGLFGHGCGLFGGGGLFNRNVQCAGPDTGYSYTPGYGANGQGYFPSYIYRSPRDFLNPNPPSIGY